VAIPRSFGFFVYLIDQAVLSNAGGAFVNLGGTTQFRLYFKKDDDNDSIADLVKFYSGNASAGNRPKLIVEYYVP